MEQKVRLKEDIEEIKNKIGLIEKSNDELLATREHLDKELGILRSRLSRAINSHPEISIDQKLPLPPGGMDELVSMQSANIEKMAQMEMQLAIIKGSPCPLMIDYPEEILKVGSFNQNNEKKKISYSYSAITGITYRIGAKDGKINFLTRSTSSSAETSAKSDGDGKDKDKYFHMKKSGISMSQRAAMFSQKNEVPLGLVEQTSSPRSSTSRSPKGGLKFGDSGF